MIKANVQLIDIYPFVRLSEEFKDDQPVYVIPTDKVMRIYEYGEDDRIAEFRTHGKKVKVLVVEVEG